MAIKPIQILINAKDDASAVFDKLQSKIKTVGVAILGYFGVKAFVGVIDGAAKLEAALSRVQAATGASADEMKVLRKTAEDVGNSGKGFLAVDAAGALENLAKAGLTATDAIKTLPAVLSLAAAGDIELGTSAEYITKAVNGLGLSFNDAARVADVLAKGANATNTSVTGLAQALSYSAPLANTLGLSLEQTVAIIGKFADAGIDASRAGTALNAIMAQFSDPASKFRTELAGAGITTVDFNTALHQLAKGGPGAERAINAVGTEAGPALRALLNQGIGKLDELVLSLKDAEGSAAATAKVMQENLKGSIRSLSGAWDTAMNALGTPVLPVLTKAVDQLAGSLRSAISDGTVAKFGAAIASAFQAGITWARNFIANFDLDGLIAKLNAFSGQAQQTFDNVGKAAENARQHREARLWRHGRRRQRRAHRDIWHRQRLRGCRRIGAQRHCEPAGAGRQGHIRRDFEEIQRCSCRGARGCRRLWCCGRRTAREGRVQFRCCGRGGRDGPGWLRRPGDGFDRCGRCGDEERCGHWRSRHAAAGHG